MDDFLKSSVSFLQGSNLLLFRGMIALVWTCLMTWKIAEFYFYDHHFEEAFIELTTWAAIGEAFYLWCMTWCTAKAMMPKEEGDKVHAPEHPGVRKPSLPGVIGVTQRVVCVFTVTVAALFHLLQAIGSFSVEKPPSSAFAPWVMHGINLIPMMLDCIICPPTFFTSDALCILGVALIHLASTVVYSVYHDEDVYGLSWKHEAKEAAALFAKAICFQQVVFWYFFLATAIPSDIRARQNFKNVYGFLKAISVFAAVMFLGYFFDWTGGHALAAQNKKKQLEEVPVAVQQNCAAWAALLIAVGSIVTMVTFSGRPLARPFSIEFEMFLDAA